jgi:hypothetical protein
MITNNKKSKRKPGRPRLAKGESKEIRKTIRFREADLKLFEKAAAKNKQEFSEWVRETLKRGL